MQFQGLAYRAIDPSWAHQPLSGEGARNTGDRFNPPGTPALYTALDILTAVREATQQDALLQPVVLLCLELDIGPVFDATDPARLAEQGLRAEDLSARDWSCHTDASGLPLTQAFAARLIAQGYAALRSHSFCEGSQPEDHNLILWHWTAPPNTVRLIDDEGRLKS